MLPKNQPYNYLENDKFGLTVHVYGKPMTGKTSFAASFPKPLILSTDGNYKHLNVPVIQIQSKYIEKQGNISLTKTGYDQMISILEDIVNHNHEPDYQYQTIVIDLVEDVLDIVKLHTLRSLNVEHEDDIEGKGWSKARFWDKFKTNFKRLLRAINSLNLNVVYISHTKNSVNKNGEVIEVVPNMSTNFTNILWSGVGMICYAETQYLNEEKQTAYVITIETTRIPVMTNTIWNNYQNLTEIIKKGE